MTGEMIYHYFREHLENIDQYEKIIVYGVGMFGRRFLQGLDKQGIKKESVKVWDKNGRFINSVYDYKVLEPNFESLIPDSKTIAIITLSVEKYRNLIIDIFEKFKSKGIDNVYIINPPPLIKRCYKASEFIDVSYSDCEYQDDIDFTILEPKVKVIAYYLPQFHEIPENDEWWGKGFTEWTNVKANTPRFKGHYQPREPHDDFGYYDLSDPEIIRKQAKLAKRHGVYGWCIYYYWFSGKKLLEKPIDILLENKDININFCLMWCNDHWSKIWVGDHKDLLIKSDYKEDDPEKFINDLKKYTADERYIRVNGKPMVVIYKPYAVPNLTILIKRWQNHAKRIGIGELYVVIQDPGDFYDNVHDKKIQYNSTLNMATATAIENFFQLVDDKDKALTAGIACYKEWKDRLINKVERGNHKSYLTCSVGFDNTPRYSRGYRIYNVGFTLRDFYCFAKYVIDEALENNKEFIFVFAWNEWCESAYLEPDKKYGYAIINTLSKAIYSVPLEDGV